MPSILGLNSSPFKETVAIKSEEDPEFARSKSEVATPLKRKLRCNSAASQESPMVSMVARTSPRRCFNSSPYRPQTVSGLFPSVSYFDSLSVL